MPEYLVSWNIHVDAQSHREAAEAAHALVRKDGSTANVYCVQERVVGDVLLSPVVIDLEEAS